MMTASNLKEDPDDPPGVGNVGEGDTSTKGTQATDADAAETCPKGSVPGGWQQYLMSALESAWSTALFAALRKLFVRPPKEEGHEAWQQSYVNGEGEDEFYEKRNFPGGWRDFMGVEKDQLELLVDLDRAQAELEKEQLM